MDLKYGNLYRNLRTTCWRLKWFLRSATEKSRLHHIRNEDMRRQIEVDRTIKKDNEKQQYVWYGHVRHMSEESN